jgi:DNA-binding transcriptional LysR family regulator
MAKTSLPRPEARPGGEAWTRRLRFRHLEVLLAIARHGSLTATGEALDITQPAVSQWLADIEAAAGAPLFIRGQRLRPTPFAAPLLAHAQRVLNDAQRTLEELQAIREGGSGRVRIGTMQVGAVALVPAVVLRLRKAGPGIALSLLEDVTAGLWSRFERNELDLLVTRLDARALASGMPSRRLFADRHRVICGPRHPLARRRRLGWQDVAGYPWLMPTEGTPLHQALEASFAGAGLPLPAPMVTSVSSVANGVLLAQTDVLGLMSTVLAERLQRQGQVAALPLTLSPDVGDVGLVWREAEPGPALAAVLRAFDVECPLVNPAAGLTAGAMAQGAAPPALLRPALPPRARAPHPSSPAPPATGPKARSRQPR